MSLAAQYSHWLQPHIWNMLSLSINQSNGMLFVLLIRNMNCVITHFHVNEKLSGMWQIYPRSTWWRHQMDTLSALQAICAGNSPVPAEFPAQACGKYIPGPHDDVIKWIHCPRYRPFVRGIPQCPLNSLHKGQWRGTLIFSLICVRINCWVNNRDAGDLRRHRSHYDIIVSEDYCPTNWQRVSFESAQRTRNAIITSLLRRFGVTMTLLLRRVSTGPLNEFGNCLYAL